MDATPPLVVVEVVEQGALDGDQPGVGTCTLLAISSTYLRLLPPSWLWDILLFCFVLICFVLVAATPPPVLGSFHPYSTHFRPSVHQHFSLEIGDLHSFHQLAIQRLVVAFHHLHRIVDILAALVVMDRVQPKDRVVLVFCQQFLKVFSSSRVRISSCLSEIRCHIFTTFLADQSIDNPLFPALTPAPPLHGKQSWQPQLSSDHGFDLLSKFSKVTPPDLSHPLHSCPSPAAFLFLTNCSYAPYRFLETALFHCPPPSRQFPLQCLLPLLFHLSLL